MKRIRYCLVYIVTLILLISCGGKIKIPPVESSSRAWPQIGGDSFHSNARVSAIHNEITSLYSLKVSSMVGRSVIAADNVLLCCTLKGYLQAFNIDDGDYIGQLKIKKGLISAPVYSKKRLYFTASETGHTLFGYDLNKGKYLWRKKLGIFESSLAIYEDKLFAANRSGTVYCLDAATGEILWRYRADSEVIADLITVKNTVITGSLKGEITALDIETGKEKWKYSSGLTLRAGPASNGRNIFWGTENSKLLALDVSTGKVFWEFETGGSVFATPAVYGNQVIFGCGDGNVYAVDAERGTRLWTFAVGAVVNTACVILGNRVYFGAHDKAVYGLDRLTGNQIWKYPLEGRVVSNPIYYDGKLVIPVEYRFLHVFGISEVL